MTNPLKKLSHLTRVSLLLAVFFALDKGIAIIRQVIIAKQFGLSAELDAFNAANNLPDMLYALISGGALAIALIPVLSEVLTKEGRERAWKLFSRIANLSFLVTGGMAVVIALLAGPLVGWELGVAPGFGPQQRALVTELMRLNLIATMIFSISGLVMAGLQANQHFFLPALAPILYNVGQIFGALVLAPTEGYQIGPLKLPAFGMGVRGLVWGVILGALLHLLIQIPALIKYRFKWIPRIGLDNPQVRQVLALLGPRVLTMLFIQFIFLARDNLASRLETGAVTALTYGWMLMQVPETLIGTAIGTAMLPTLAELIARDERLEFKRTVERAGRVLLALTIPVALVAAAGIKPLIAAAFGFDAAGTNLVALVTQAYLAGLIGHSLLELAARSFYAQQNARIPLYVSALNALVFALLAALLLKPLGAVGIALANSLAYTAEAILLFVLLNRHLPEKLAFGSTIARALAGGLVGGALTYAVAAGILLPPSLILTLAVLPVGLAVALPLVWREVRLMLRL